MQDKEKAGHTHASKRVLKLNAQYWRRVYLTFICVHLFFFQNVRRITFTIRSGYTT
jgi:hypothetical protein